LRIHSQPSLYLLTLYKRLIDVLYTIPIPNIAITYPLQNLYSLNIHFVSVFISDRFILNFDIHLIFITVYIHQIRNIYKYNFNTICSEFIPFTVLFNPLEKIFQPLGCWIKPTQFFLSFKGISIYLLIYIDNKLIENGFYRTKQ
jgi:hypothetical protein